MRVTTPLQIKADSISSGEFVGYASAFEGEPDSYGDVIARGAFSQTLIEHKQEGTMPALLWAHDQARPIGRWLSFEEDDRGLKATGKLTLETHKGKEAHALMRDGALGLSIGFRTLDAEDKGPNRVLKSLELVEVSLVAIPANRRAVVTDVKSALQDIRSFERAARDSLGLSARQAKRLANGGYSALAKTHNEFDPDALAEIAQALNGITKQLRI